MAELLEGYRTSKDIKEDIIALKIELAFQERFDGEMDALLMEEERDPEVDKPCEYFMANSMAQKSYP